jgi:hypothetical protein
MFRILLGAFSFLCLIAAGLLLWQSHPLAGGFPHGAAGWMAQWFVLFQDPVTAAVLVAGAFLLAAASACVSELLLGFLLSALSALISVSCLLGLLGGHYPMVAEHVEKWLR